MSLDRFQHAQSAAPGGFATALAELQAGRKTSHWIWYVFPQLAGLGHSPMAQAYALRDLAEAREYLADPTLRERLRQAVDVVATQLAAGVPLTTLMGGRTDSLKLVSSLTLFEQAAETAGDVALAESAELADACGRVLNAAADQGFSRCAFTLAHAR